MKYLILFFVPLLVHAKVQTEKVVYEKNGVKMEGLVAFDDTKKNAPGVLVFHDWMGNGPYTEMRAKQLAEQGYVAFAADIYGEGVRPKNGKEASELATKYKTDRKTMRERAEAALTALKGHARVNKDKIAAIGFCFGGTAALELARMQAPILGVVSFHGGLGTPMKAEKMNAKILVLHGGDDPFVPATEVSEFQEEMRKAKADWQFVSYGNTVHSFTHKEAGNDNSKGAAYNELSEKRSMREMKDFFSDIF